MFRLFFHLMSNRCFEWFKLL